MSERSDSRRSSSSQRSTESRISRYSDDELRAEAEKRGFVISPLPQAGALQEHDDDTRSQSSVSNRFERRDRGHQPRHQSPQPGCLESCCGPRVRQNQEAGEASHRSGRPPKYPYRRPTSDRSPRASPASTHPSTAHQTPMPTPPGTGQQTPMPRSPRTGPATPRVRAPAHSVK